jgi:hypothetical protein
MIPFGVKAILTGRSVESLKLQPFLPSLDLDSQYRISKIITLFLVAVTRFVLAIRCLQNFPSS